MGGKVEPNETPLDCMVRECHEETSLQLPAAKWVPYATILESYDPDGKSGSQIELFACLHHGDPAEATHNDHEKIEWFPVDSLPENVITNLHYLIPMARTHLQGHESQEITIRY